jgi:hypothetical protein
MRSHGAAKMARPELPKIIFVAREYSDRKTGGRNTWLNAETDVTRLAELNESIYVGRYELVEISTLNGVPILGNTRKVK